MGWGWECGEARPGAQRSRPPKGGAGARLRLALGPAPRAAPRLEVGEGAEGRPEAAEWGSQHRAMLMPCACGGCPGGKEGQGPGVRGQGWVKEGQYTWQRSMRPHQAQTQRACCRGLRDGAGGRGGSGQTHLTEERAVRPRLHLHQDPARRPRPERQPQVPRRRHNHVTPEVPPQGAVAAETVGLGHGCGDRRGKVTGPLRSKAGPAGPRPPPRPPLTEPTVSAAEAHRTVAAEAAPPLRAAAAVLARV